jgi:hypothetical protein
MEQKDNTDKALKNLQGPTALEKLNLRGTKVMAADGCRTGSIARGTRLDPRRAPRPTNCRRRPCILCLDAGAESGVRLFQR